MEEKESLGTIRGFFVLMRAWIQTHPYGAAIIGILALAVMIFVLMAIARGEDPLTDDPVSSGEESAATGETETDPEPPPSQEELAVQDPIPLTDGPWRFWADSSEAAPLFDIQFEADGTCFVPGDDIVYGGEYTESGGSVEIVLHRRYDAEAKNADGDIRTETVDWDVWFHMTRTGNTMTGLHEAEAWRLSYDDGLEWNGVQENSPASFARPERPDDEG